MTGRVANGRLDGRVAIVTGASRGMGRSIATTFAAEGAKVAVVARTEQQWDERLPGTVHETVAEIRAAGGEALAVAADLANPDDIERLVSEARDAFGPIDVLVNNAALTVPGRPPKDGAPARTSAMTPTGGGTAVPTGLPGFLEFPLKGFRLHYEVGLFSTYRLMQLVLPDMLTSGRGAIVNISSYAAEVPGEGPYPGKGTATTFAYGGNKTAMHHLTQAVAYEFGDRNVAVNALAPSKPVYTPGNLWVVPDYADFDDPAIFAEATLRLALADPTVTNGQILYSEDVLHPEHGRRGWLGDKVL